MNRQSASQTHQQANTAPTLLAGGLLQRKCDCGQHTIAGSKCSECSEEREGSLQRSALNRDSTIEHHGAVPPIVHEVLRSSGQPLDAATRAFFEPRFGHDFSRVRVHTDATAAESASAVKARAYTAGQDIVFEAGRYSPHSSGGKLLLAHELTHVVQQANRLQSQPAGWETEYRGDAAEQEAQMAAEAVARGGSFRPRRAPSSSLARDVDGGAASATPDAGTVPDAGPKPSDAGVSPDAGAPAGPTPDTKPAPDGGSQVAPAPAPLAVKIDRVTFRGWDNRIAPTQTADVPVTVSNLPVGNSLSLDVQGSGGDNGTATITAGAALASSGSVTVKGGTQTEPGHAHSLRIRARTGATTVATSPGFTVAAFPKDWTSARVNDINSGSAVGLKVQDGWKSDGSGPITELDKVGISELVDIHSRNNPPFTSDAGTSTTSGTSGYNAGDALTTDSHTYGKGSIDTTGLAHGSYNLVYDQLCIFKCARTGITDKRIRNSGYQIKHRVWWDNGSSKWKHKTVKAGAATTVGSFSAFAGTGNDSSDEHDL